jgi:hypothetical protein
MRIESSVTSISWIPSEAVTGANKAAFAAGFTHYDNPPPDVVDDLDALRAADGFRFANHLAAWIDVQDGRVVDSGYSGSGVMGSTTVRLGKEATFAAVALDDIQRDPEELGTAVRFVQTTGGRTALPAPRRVNHPPFVQFQAPTVWTTLALTINVDGSSSFELTGASSFPRHWVYDDSGKLAQKAGLADFKEWYRHAFGKHTPWGDQDSRVLVTAVETALERELSHTIMRGDAKPKVKKVRKGKTIVEQGDSGTDVYLVLDGVVGIEVDGEPLAEFGPGAVLGERALLEGGTRTSTNRALTNVRVAVAAEDQLDRDALVRLSEGHRHEERS